jgi:hypothetical protein
MCGAVATSSANTLRHLGPYEGFNMVIAMDCLAAAPPGHQFACGSPMKFGATVPKPTDRFFLNSPCNHADATARKCSAVYIGRNSDGFKTSCPKEYPERFNAQDLRVPLQIGWSSSFDRVE